MSFGQKKNLILHDYFENFGGGERLVTNLYNTNTYDLVYGFDNNNLVRKKGLQKNSHKLIKLKLPNILKKLLLIKKFQNLTLKKSYHNYFISGTYSIFFNKEYNGQKIFYCYSLPKLFFYFNKFYTARDIIQIIIYFFYGKKFRKKFLNKLKEMNVILCVSKYTQNNLKKYSNLKSIVVYPPIDINKFKWISQKKYFVSNSRHENEKNLDKIINVFKKFQQFKIYLTSKGSKTNYLKKLAENSNNIIFTDLLTEKKYSYLLGNCCATINISRFEDFGMAAVEGLAAGKPSISIKEGGYLETIKNGHNGFLLNRLNLEKDLSDLLNKLDFKKLYSMKDNCIKSAKKYSKKKFIKKISKLTN
jgi:glycosyltransferase involved in cell wall biosynthesis